MKKAKIMLTALVVLTVVGGALAFKAKEFGTVTLYFPHNGSSTCPDAGADYKTTTASVPNLTATTTQNATCVTIKNSTTSEN